MDDTLRLVLARQNDWEALYVNGEMAVDGQPLSAAQVVDALSESCLRIDFRLLEIDDGDEMPFRVDADEEWLD